MINIRPLQCVQILISALSENMLIRVPHIPYKHTGNILFKAIKNAMKEYPSQHIKKDSPAAIIADGCFRSGWTPKRIEINPMLLKRYPI